MINVILAFNINCKQQTGDRVWKWKFHSLILQIVKFEDLLENGIEIVEDIFLWLPWFL